MGKKKKKKRSLRRLPKKSALEEFVNSGLHLFWLAHGANYLASDLERTLWRQIFNVYEDAPPSREEILRELRSRFEEGTTVRWWCDQKPRFHLSVYEDAERKIKGVASGEACLREPHNEFVWEVFERLRTN